MLVLAILLLQHVGGDIAVLNPKGLIAQKQRELMFTATGLMLIVVIPVFILLFVVAWKFRADNREAKYSPDWDHHRIIEFVWWSVPCVIIFVLGIVTWKNTHALDPFKPIDSNVKPIRIQVIALDWKWLFIYPEEKIAAVNWVQFPQQTPIAFEITADAPMNSLWIPQLGGQIYAMPGMKTELHLIANSIGNFRGSSANLSGKGFAGMNFIAKASSQEDFDRWVQSIKQTGSSLDQAEYSKLAEPSAYHPVAAYRLIEEGLYDRIVMKYMVKDDSR